MPLMKFVLALMLFGSASCVRMLIPNNPLFGRLFDHGANFSREQGTKLDIISSASLNSMAEEVRVDLGASSDPLNAYDAYCLKTTWVPELADAGLLENLIEYIRNKPEMRWPDVLPFAREYLSTYGRSTFVVPNDADFFYMAYRNDIFSKFEIQSPETWEDFLKIAARLNGTDMNNDGVGDFGTCWVTAQDAYFFPYWMAIASTILQYEGTQQGILIQPDTNELLVSNEGFDYVANLHRNISRYARKQQTWNDQSRDFLAGRCAMTINLPGGIKTISLGKLAPTAAVGNDPIMTRRAPGSSVVWNRKASRLMSCTEEICKHAEFGRGGSNLINRSPFYGTGGWAFAIRKSADAAAKKAIFDFISYVNEPEQSIRDVAAGTPFDTFRSSHLATDDVFLKSGWSLSRLQELRAITKDALGHPNAALDFAFPGQNDLSTAFSTNLYGFFTEQQPLGRVKEQVLLAWNKLQLKYGNDKLRNLVRQSIGLSPIEAKPGGPDVVLPTVVTCGAVVIALIGTLGFIQYHKHKLDSIWIIDTSEITYDDPIFCLGQGTAWSVFRAYYRGTTVAVKRACARDGEVGSSYMDLEYEKPGGRNVLADGQAVRGPIAGGRTAEAASIQTKELWVAQQDRAMRKKNLMKRASSSNLLGSAINVMAKARADFIAEMRLISQLRHPCITTVMGAIVDKGSEPALVVECMSNGSLRDLVHNKCIPLDAEMALPMLRDVAQGMRFLHAGTPPIVHGDLKSSNVLVDANFRAKVADFGISHKAKTGAVGSPRWMAPELLRGQKASKMSDVYAFGITMWEVLARREPYATLHPQYTRAEVLEMVRDSALRPDIECIQRQDLLRLMQECWADEVSERPTFEAVEKVLLPLISQDVYGAARLTQAGRPMDVLHDVFPRHVAEALVAGRKVEPEQHDCVTIYFSDIVGFTDISAQLAPIEVSEMLHRLYTRLDALADRHGVFKVETIGDAWMGVTNVVEAQPDHAARIARFALEAICAARATPIRADDPDAGTVRIRVGFHSGPVVANVVGTRNPRYCLFGDTVNTASRMESNSEVLRIHCSEAAALLVMQQDPKIELTLRGKIPIKGKGHMLTYWVERVRDEEGIQKDPEESDTVNGGEQGLLQKASLSEVPYGSDRGDDFAGNQLEASNVPITVSATASLSFDMPAGGGSNGWWG